MMHRQNFELTTCNDALGLEYNFRLHINRPKRCRYSTMQSALIMCVGVFLGFILCDFLRQNLRLHQSCTHTKCCNTDKWFGFENLKSRLINHKPLTNDIPKKLVYVGVMTAEKYLNSRAKAVFDTWAKTIPGRVEFFTSAKYNNKSLPLVKLSGVEDNVYPPQKKSFMMLKYMHDNHIDDYEWFIRADDDVFIHGDRLQKFLRPLNSSKTLYLGQAGQGVHSEHGLLGLDALDNYCMGGPTMIFSRATLRKMVPEINFCIKHLVSMHEDVEIGRCVRKFADTHCPWAFEFRNLFYQNHDEANGSFTRPGLLPKLVKPITMHPVKDSRHLYRMQVHFQSMQLREMRHRNLLLYRDVKTLQTLSGLHPHKHSFPAFPVVDKLQPDHADDVIPWIYFDQNYYSPGDVNMKRKIPQSLFIGLDNVVTETMRLINARARELGRHIDFRGLLYGYTRVDPLHSADYITDLLLSYHKHRGKHLKLPVRRHSYLHQPFTEPEIRLSKTTEVPIYFVVPVMGRRNAFSRFIQNYEKIALKRGEKTHLVFVLFDPVGGADYITTVQANVQMLKSRYPNSKIDFLPGKGTFSRAAALYQGSLFCPDDALLLFIDLDIEFQGESLKRIRANTQLGIQAYFPVVFSQYNPRIVCNSTHNHCTDHFILTRNSGYWRHFGFGIVGIYRRDFFNVGGFDLDIEGWGKEDVDLYEKCLSKNLTVFRAPDTGLIHMYHDVVCPESLPLPQLRMCLGSRRSNLAPVGVMTEMLLERLGVDGENRATPNPATHNDVK